MSRYLLASALLVSAATTARAHFVYIVPAADGSKLQVVFSDSLVPDENVDIAKIAALKLQVRAAGATDAPLALAKAEHALTGAVPGRGHRVVYGSVPYGVMQRGDSKPFLLQYHPKALIGELSAKPVGDALPAEIVPVLTGGKLSFLVLGRGKPQADTEVTVLAPGKGESKKVKTDAAGRTPEFDARGRYGVWAKVSEKKSGEQGGKKYEEIRHYATLVVDFGK